MKTLEQLKCETVSAILKKKAETPGLYWTWTAVESVCKQTWDACLTALSQGVEGVGSMVDTEIVRTIN